MNKTYKVQVFDDNNWRTYSFHKNLENGIINADVYHRGHNFPVRVIFEGQIVYEIA